MVTTLARLTALAGGGWSRTRRAIDVLGGPAVAERGAASAYLAYYICGGDSGKVDPYWHFHPRFGTYGGGDPPKYSNYSPVEARAFRLNNDASRS